MENLLEFLIETKQSITDIQRLLKEDKQAIDEYCNECCWHGRGDQNTGYCGGCPLERFWIDG